MEDRGAQGNAYKDVDPIFTPAAVPITFHSTTPDLAISIDIIGIDSEWIYKDVMRARTFPAGNLIYILYNDSIVTEANHYRRIYHLLER